MKYKMVLWLVSVYSVYTMDIQTATHWMVTETGLVQPKIDSHFEMARPYDLLAFLNQDTRWDNIRKLYNELSKRQTMLNSMWSEIEKETDVTSQVTRDKNCIAAGPIHLLDWYTSHLEDGKSKIPQKEFMLKTPTIGQNVDVPDCKKISSLIFSMASFDHLESIIHRENLTARPELALPEQISPIMTVDQFGHWITSVLRRNTSSWLHYNMASLYWRVRGNAPKAIECSRRALHYAPRRYKDLALLSMGTILHRSDKIEDAITVLGAAVDHDPKSASNHFMLANTYAIFGHLNYSLMHLDECLKLDPSFDLAEKHRLGVLCHAAVVKQMEIIRDELQIYRSELKEFTAKEAQWLKSQAAFLRTMKHSEDFDYRNVEKNCEMMTKLTGLDIKDLKKEADKNSLIQYFFDGPLYKEQWLQMRGVGAIDGALNVHRLIKHIAKHADMASQFVIQSDHVNVPDGAILQEIGPIPVPPDLARVSITIEDTKKSSQGKSTGQPQEDFFEFQTGIALYPPTMKVSRTTEDFDTDRDWPTNSLCKDTAPGFPENVEAIFPAFLPFENKGIRLKTLLTDKIGVPANVEHDLPWHPPACPQDKETAAFSQKKSPKQQVIGEVIPTDYLRQKLLEYVGDGNIELVKNMQDTEIGQRIYAAMQMNIAPKWLMYTLSSLYWRVRGNNINALNCLLNAVKTAKARYKDIVLISLASVYLEMGHFDEALATGEEAFRLSLYEPATNFILAELNMIRKNRNTHMFHLKQVLRVEPTFMGGLARHLLNGWACILKQVNALQELADFGEEDVCKQVEPGMSMVCEKDGTNCHVANIQCFSGSEKESSTIVRMLEQKVGSSDHLSSDYIDDSIFTSFIENMPHDRGDRAGHYENYQVMMRAVSRALQGCGPRGCTNIQPEDLALKAEDCTHQHLQLGYWLHIISFRQLLTNDDLRLPPEILTMSPMGKKFPECRLLADPNADFFLERLSRVDGNGWKPVLSFMHQFAEIFNFVDYVTLGAKITKYIETNPRSWLGALAAGWWCGAGGRGACAVHCFTAAYALAPPELAAHPLRALATLLHSQSKQQDAKDVAYLTFYMSPRSKIEAFFAAVSHTYLAEYEQAVWMYRYALTFDDRYLPAKACLHATICLMLFGEGKEPPRDF